MKTIGLEHTTLAACVKDARHERVVLTHKGKPVALVVGVKGLDEEQLQLSSSDTFWTLIEARRKQRTISRAELEQRTRDTSGSKEMETEKREIRARRSAPNKRAAPHRRPVTDSADIKKTRLGGSR
jgi:antitoxin (DNA-binding transcriptional repressor) of toxin-antitoxin stability system